MRKITIAIMALVLVSATTAQAQQGGGRGGGHGGGGRHGGGGAPPAPGPADGPPPPRQAPMNQIMIVGVVRALDPTTERVTIAYDPVEQLNWPAGSMPFAVGKAGLLTDVKVGQKVRFRLENQRIVELSPFDAAKADAPGGGRLEH